MKIADTVRLILLGAWTLLLGTPAILVGLLLPNRTLKGRLFGWVSRTYSRIVLLLFGVTLETRGLPRIDPSAPYVFMSNHVSHIDSIALAMSLPRPMHWVFKKELSKVPVLGWVLLSLGQVMVDRKDALQARGALYEAAKGLAGNNSIMIYPEGTRSKDGRLQPLKKGGFFIAVHAGLPIVPVRVSGSHDIVPSGSVRVRPGHVVVDLFDPIPTAGKSDADIPDLMARVRKTLLSS